MHIKAIRPALLEEQLFKVVLQVCLRDRLEHGDLLLLPVEIILVCAQFLFPEAIELLVEVVFTLRYISHDSADDRSEIFIREQMDFLAHSL